MSSPDRFYGELQAAAVARGKATRFVSVKDACRDAGFPRWVKKVKAGSLAKLLEAGLNPGQSRPLERGDDAGNYTYVIPVTQHYVDAMSNGAGLPDEDEDITGYIAGIGPASATVGWLLATDHPEDANRRVLQRYFEHREATVGGSVRHLRARERSAAEQGGLDDDDGRRPVLLYPDPSDAADKVLTGVWVTPGETLMIRGPDGEIRAIEWTARRRGTGSHT